MPLPSGAIGPTSNSPDSAVSASLRLEQRNGLPLGYVPAEPAQRGPLELEWILLRIEEDCIALVRCEVPHLQSGRFCREEVATVRADDTHTDEMKAKLARIEAELVEVKQQLAAR
jgi:hypothetical protein